MRFFTMRFPLGVRALPFLALPCAKVHAIDLCSWTIAGYGTTATGNSGNFLAVGPFALRSDGATEFTWFIGRATDTLSYQALIGAVGESYLRDFRDAQPIVLPALTASDVHVTAAQRDSVQKVNVRIQLRLPTRVADEFIERVLTQLESSDPTAAELRRLNPRLIDTVRSRMQQNLARILVFKSCNRGRTWTDATGACESAASSRTQTMDGATPGVGWKAFRIINAGGLPGDVAAHVISDVVLAGREYLYSFVSQTRGLSDVRVVISETVDASGKVTSRSTGSLWDAMFIDVDTVTSALATRGPTTVLVSAPATFPAGGVGVRIDAIHVVPNPFVVQSVFGRVQSSGLVHSRVLFVNVPKEGMLRVYTISGQMVQQLSWTASDLVVAGDDSPHGDLPYNLRTREGRDLATGLYLYVITARDAGASSAVARGKFVVIR